MSRPFDTISKMTPLGKLVAIAAREITNRGEPVNLSLVKNTIGLMVLNQLRSDVIAAFDAGVIPADLAEQILILAERVEEQEIAARIEIDAMAEHRALQKGKCK